jgi:hypothetical protein
MISIKGYKGLAMMLGRVGLSAAILVFILSVNNDLTNISGVEGAPDSASVEYKTLQAGWNKIPGGSNTFCSMGAPYYFFYRPGNPQQLLIHFQGGGACWNSRNCDLNQSPTYDPSVEDSDQPNQNGIFDFANPENPFKDFTVAYVTYCTADLHLGNRVAVYIVPATGPKQVSTLKIHHNGYHNVMAAIKWVFANTSSPQTIFVSGESAGAIASPFFAAFVADHYKRSRIIQLGDGGGGYRTPVVTKMLEGWGAMKTIKSLTPYRNRDIAINFESLYIMAARHKPSIRFSQYNSIDDSTQRHFLGMIGMEDAQLRQLLEQNYADIRESCPTFRTFTAPGEKHVILSRPEFYTLKVRDVRFRDWVADLIVGKSLEDVKPASAN